MEQKSHYSKKKNNNNNSNHVHKRSGNVQLNQYMNELLFESDLFNESVECFTEAFWFGSWVQPDDSMIWLQ